ncbi:hypothetical protein DFH09DRAFT_1168649 [Mycena vulgaris]|nr:hypothetical protein DFH09DRAFT_1168649 [Mycena vulgaris]
MDTIEAPPHLPVVLNRIGSNPALGAIEYTPAKTISFNYERHAFTTVASSEITYYGAIFGTNMSPLIRICFPDRHPWSERFKKLENIQRPLAGPPFEFWSVDWNGGKGLGDPSDLEFHAVALSPDLPGQLADDVEPNFTEGREQDSSKGLGWQGAWVVALLEKQARAEPLGERTEIIWNSTQNPAWGMRVRLQAIQVVAREDDEDEVNEEEFADIPSSPGISDYEVRATIQRVFVRSEEIARLREPEDPEPEDEEEEMEDEYGSEHEY